MAVATRSENRVVIARTADSAPIWGPDDPEYVDRVVAVLLGRLSGLDIQVVSINRATSLAYVNGDPAFDPDGRIVDLAPVR